MKKALTIILLSAAVLLLGGCGKKENEDLNVLNHDFTEQEWSDFLDEKMAKEAAEAEKADADAGNSDSGSGNKSSLCRRP